MPSRELVYVQRSYAVPPKQRIYAAAIEEAHSGWIAVVHRIRPRIRIPIALLGVVELVKRVLLGPAHRVRVVVAHPHVVEPSLGVEELAGKAEWLRRRAG